MAFVFLLYALFASIFTIGKASLEFAQPFFIIGSRMFLAGILILGFQYFRDKKTFKFDKSCWIQIGLMAVLSIYITNICEFWALQFLTSGKACFLYSLTPFLSSFFAYLILSE